MSNHLGAGDYRAAQSSLEAALALGGGTVLVTATAVFAGRHLWPRIFSSNGHVVALASSVLAMTAVFSLFDGLLSIFRGLQGFDALICKYLKETSSDLPHLPVLFMRRILRFVSADIFLPGMRHLGY